MEKYIVKEGKKLRYGYTTGSCAAAASKAAVKGLLEQKEIKNIKISTPKGWDLDLKTIDFVFNENYAFCGIVKDGGDDPDATHGIAIYSKVKWREDNKINIDGGIGVGRVTKKGLPIPVNRPAINPVPLQMIEREVREIIGYGRGVDVEISVPMGEKIAEKTFNPRLGIIGGISILGTSGIVEPMSEEAWKESLALELSIAKEEGRDEIIFVPGNYGRDLVRDEFQINESKLIKTSNFIGYMLDKAVEYNIKKILLVGHIGKLVKVAGGIFHTHSKIADGRREILASHLAVLGGSPEEVSSVLNCNTTEEAVELIKTMDREEVFNIIAEKITEKSRERTMNKIEIGTIIFSMEHGVLSICPVGKNLLEEFKQWKN